MIMIWDNGGDYSDHAIYFVDIGDVAVEHAAKLMDMYSGGHIVGLVKVVEWRDDGPRDLFDMVGPHFNASMAEDVPTDLLLRVIDREEKRLQASLVESMQRGWKNEANIARAIEDIRRQREAVTARGRVA